jgi:hypothetical protein
MLSQTPQKAGLASLDKLGRTSASTLYFPLLNLVPLVTQHRDGCALGVRMRCRSDLGNFHITFAGDLYTWYDSSSLRLRLATLILPNVDSQKVGSALGP